MKTHETTKTNGSIRMTNNHMVDKNNKIPQCPAIQQKKELCDEQQKEKSPSIEIDECNESKTIATFKVLNGQTRRNLMKHKTDELKFIDTSCESDLPPTLSQLQRKSVQIEEIPVVLESPTTPSTLNTTIISLENEQRQLNSINEQNVTLNSVGNNKQTASMKNAHDIGVDSAVEDSTVSLEQVDVFIMTFFKTHKMANFTQLGVN